MGPPSRAAMILKVVGIGETLTSSQIRERILIELGEEIRGVSQLIKIYLLGEYMERLPPEKPDDPLRYRRLR